jgi:hypothetical protein
MVSTNSNAQGVLFDPDRIHKTTAAYKDLLDFVVRLRNVAPFNAMLLQVQKPGLTYAASGSRLAREVRSQTKRRRTAAADSLALWACGASTM